MAARGSDPGSLYRAMSGASPHLRLAPLLNAASRASTDDSSQRMSGAETGAETVAVRARLTDSRRGDRKKPRRTGKKKEQEGGDEPASYSIWSSLMTAHATAKVNDSSAF